MMKSVLLATCVCNGMVGLAGTSEGAGLKTDSEGDMDARSEEDGEAERVRGADG